MKQQKITVTANNTVFIPSLSDSTAKAFYSALLEKITELSKSEKTNAA